MTHPISPETGKKYWWIKVGYPEPYYRLDPERGIVQKILWANQHGISFVLLKDKDHKEYTVTLRNKK